MGYNKRVSDFYRMKVERCLEIMPLRFGMHSPQGLREVHIRGGLPGGEAGYHLRPRIPHQGRGHDVHGHGSLRGREVGPGREGEDLRPGVRRRPQGARDRPPPPGPLLRPSGVGGHIQEGQGEGGVPEVHMRGPPRGTTWREDRVQRLGDDTSGGRAGAHIRRATRLLLP